MALIGYSLVKDGTEVQSWTDIPSEFKRPGVHVYCPAVGADYQGYKIVERYADPLPADTVKTGESSAFDGVKVVVTYTYSPSSLDALKTQLVSAVDDHIAVLYSKWTRFESEYVEREAAARAFKDAGYTGDPTSWVSRFATNTGKTNQQAADLIIAQADTLRSALATLGNLRMDKYLIQAQATHAAARAKHAEIIAAADAAVAGL